MIRINGDGTVTAVRDCSVCRIRPGKVWTNPPCALSCDKCGEPAIVAEYICDFCHGKPIYCFNHWLSEYNSERHINHLTI